MKLQKIHSFDLEYEYGTKPLTRRSSGIVNSVLAREWFKFEIDQTGVYRFDRSFLNGLGMTGPN